MGEDKQMEKFTLYWRDGKREVVEGYDCADAMTRAGYGGGAVRALDFYATGDCDRYWWDGEGREWHNKEITPERVSGIPPMGS